MNKIEHNFIFIVLPGIMRFSSHQYIAHYKKKKFQEDRPSGEHYGDTVKSKQFSLEINHFNTNQLFSFKIDVMN